MFNYRLKSKGITRQYYYMKKCIFPLLACLLTLSLCGCKILNSQVKPVLIEGVRGQVFEKKGNVMPVKGKVSSKGAIFNTIVYVFEPTTLSKVEGLNGQFCTKVNSVLVDSLKTSIEGKFLIALKPGKYSLMVKYDQGYFVPYFSGTNELSIIEILPNVVSELDIIVNVKASY